MSEDNALHPQTFTPMQHPVGHAHPAEVRIAFALEAVAAALCRIDHRLNKILVFQQNQRS